MKRGMRRTKIRKTRKCKKNRKTRRCKRGGSHPNDIINEAHLGYQMDSAPYKV